MQWADPVPEPELSFHPPLTLVFTLNLESNPNPAAKPNCNPREGSGSADERLTISGH